MYYLKSTIDERMIALEELATVARIVRRVKTKRLCMTLYWLQLFSDWRDCSELELADQVGICPRLLRSRARHYSLHLYQMLKTAEITSPESALSLLFELLDVSYNDDLDRWRAAQVRYRLDKERRSDVIVALIDQKLISFIKAVEVIPKLTYRGPDLIERWILGDRSVIPTKDLDCSAIREYSRRSHIQNVEISDRLDLKYYRQSPITQQIVVDGQLICIRFNNLILTHPRKISERSESLTSAQRSVVARLYERFKIKMSPELMGFEEKIRRVVFDLLRA